ncbi:MAG: hypothetical protein ACRDJU_04915 [Actinomycetota bacterium]
MSDRGQRHLGDRRHPKLWVVVVLLAIGAIALAGCSSSPSKVATGNADSTSGGGNGAAAALGNASSGGTGGSGANNASGSNSGSSSNTSNGSSKSTGKSGSNSASNSGSGGKTGNGNSSSTGGSNSGASGASNGSAGSTGAGSAGGSNGGGTTFNLPGATGGNVFTASPKPGGSSSGGGSSSTTPPSPPASCANPTDPATVAQGITGGHMDSVDSSGTAHGPATSFSAGADTKLLAVLYLSGDIVTNTVITYVQIYCGTIVDSEDFTLSGQSADLYITFNASPTFPVGPYRLQLYVNATANSAPAFNLDYAVTA